MAMVFYEERGMEVAARIWKGFEKARRGYEIVQGEAREAEEGGWRVGLQGAGGGGAGGGRAGGGRAAWGV